jgi:hypothetical protein
LAQVRSDAHCRISLADGTLGSGTLIDRNESVGLVLTCAHLFEGCPSQIVVSFPRGGKFGARLIEIDRANDLVALTIRRPEVAPLTVAEGEPAGVLTACGFGPSGVFRAIQGRITGQALAAGAAYPSTTMCGAVRPGDSGGAILNTRGQLAGVVWGQRDGQTYSTCGRAVHEFLAKVRSTLFASHNPQPPAAVPQSPTPQLDLAAFANDIDARLRALDAKKQDKGHYLQHGDLNGYVSADDIAKLTGPLAVRTEVESKIGAVASKFESVRERIEQISTTREGILNGISLAKLAVGALGLSGPLAIAVVIAGGFVGGRVRSRLSRLESHIGLPKATPPASATKSQAVAVDSPPPPQQTLRETHYVPIEQDTFSQAHQWASEHVARKYPGATEVLQAQDSLIKQFLAARRE